MTIPLLIAPTKTLSAPLTQGLLQTNEEVSTSPNGSDKIEPSNRFERLYSVISLNKTGERKVGELTRLARLRKIMKYKNKQKLWRESHPVTRIYTGRRRVAGDKPRIRGRFVKGGAASA